MLRDTPYEINDLSDSIYGDQVFNLSAPNFVGAFMKKADEMGLVSTMNGTRATLDQAIEMMTAVTNAGCWGPDHRHAPLAILVATRDALPAKPLGRVLHLKNHMTGTAGIVEPDGYVAVKWDMKYADRGDFSGLPSGARSDDLVALPTTQVYLANPNFSYVEETHSFVGEASDLGLAPGEWPGRIAVVGESRVEVYEKRGVVSPTGSNEIAAVMYQPISGVGYVTSGKRSDLPQVEIVND